MVWQGLVAEREAAVGSQEGAPACCGGRCGLGSTVNVRAPAGEAEPPRCAAGAKPSCLRTQCRPTCCQLEAADRGRTWNVWVARSSRRTHSSRSAGASASAARRVTSAGGGGAGAGLHGECSMPTRLPPLGRLRTAPPLAARGEQHHSSRAATGSLPSRGQGPRLISGKRAQRAHSPAMTKAGTRRPSASSWSNISKAAWKRRYLQARTRYGSNGQQTKPADLEAYKSRAGIITVVPWTHARCRASAAQGQAPRAGPCTAAPLPAAWRPAHRANSRTAHSMSLPTLDFWAGCTASFSSAISANSLQARRSAGVQQAAVGNRWHVMLACARSPPRRPAVPPGQPPSCRAGAAARGGGLARPPPGGACTSSPAPSLSLASVAKLWRLLLQRRLDGKRVAAQRGRQAQRLCGREEEAEQGSRGDAGGAAGAGSCQGQLWPLQRHLLQASGCREWVGRFSAAIAAKNCTAAAHPTLTFI